MEIVYSYNNKNNQRKEHLFDLLNWHGIRLNLNNQIIIIHSQQQIIHMVLTFIKKKKNNTTIINILTIFIQHQYQII